nr:hypothetical protein [Tanacetum cinerariifolium]
MYMVLGIRYIWRGLHLIHWLGKKWYNFSYRRSHGGEVSNICANSLPMKVCIIRIQRATCFYLLKIPNSNGKYRLSKKQGSVLRAMVSVSTVFVTVAHSKNAPSDHAYTIKFFRITHEQQTSLELMLLKTSRIYSKGLLLLVKDLLLLVQVDAVDSRLRLLEQNVAAVQIVSVVQIVKPVSIRVNTVMYKLILLLTPYSSLKDKDLQESKDPQVPVAPTTAKQRLARKNELKARGTLLMSLPDKHQL